MSLAEQIALRVFREIDPETATATALRLLCVHPFLPGAAITSNRLEISVAGLRLPNPVGLAAGFDKNAVAIAPLLKAGFGFVELGTVTPRPQTGNPKPRIFRLGEDRAVINRMGFPNQGQDIVARRLAHRTDNGIVGLNLGTNKDSTDRIDDYTQVLATCGNHIDFATVNVSSPNTENLRDLQERSALVDLLAKVTNARAGLSVRTPVFLKVSPDLSDRQVAEIATVAMDAGIEGIIATNTTLGRDGLNSPYRAETGGLSGTPLFERSTRILARFGYETGGALPLIGVGGIGSAHDGYVKIRAGASAVQLYTALTFQGISLVTQIVKGLDSLLERDGFANIAEAVGSDRDKWL